ncbi:hypothetical protein EW145_g2759 [Phellinidium pouzarii]|uniref:P-loop containing nucleoside triphosphate hydrolase protein n=1 Tax=Phellinidium pouzarii TaxID=167371 RepID=A0A4S4L9T1_9AGAM|nr:hypothetical protein EW145_g2759 [Phellinidium pouzarii]
MPPLTPPYLLLSFYAMNLVLASIDLFSAALREDSDILNTAFSALNFVLSSILIYTIGTLPIKNTLPGASVASVDEVPSSSKTMPEDSVTLWQWCTFSFVEPLLDVALARRLEQTDVWSLSPFFKHKNIFRKYLDYRGRHPHHSLIRFLIVSNSLDLILDIVLEFWGAVGGFGCIYALQRILSALEKTPKAKPEAYFFAFVTFVINLSFAQVDAFQAWHSRRSYERTRGQLFCALHHKALRRRDISGTVGSSEDSSNTSDDGADLGKIVNLMQGDAYTLSFRFWQASAVFALSVRLVMSLVFLHGALGWSSLAGVVVVLVAYVLNYPLGKYNVQITRESWKAKDTFTSLALFSSLQSPMMELPEQLFSFLHAYVSYQRINAFFQEEEVPPWASDLICSVSSEESEVKFGFKDAIFEWNASSGRNLHREHFQLGPLNIEFPLGQLSLVTGATGSGKSALLVALLGELYCSHGKIFINKINHQVAYCAQNCWLEQATIRDNIVFGSLRGYDESRYLAVVEACALPRDLAMFDAGDLTEIGERGVTLSGGQRARISLARALYSEAKYILLDDPLAAVDMHTAQHIVEHCLRGDLARGRTIILVTHHISMCLSTASYIVELERGKVIRQDTVKNLQTSGQLKVVLYIEDDANGAIDSASAIDLQEASGNEADAEGLDVARITKPLPSGKLVEAEHRAEGRVSLYTYFTYVRAAGWISWVATFGLMLLTRLIAIANDLFLAEWSEAFERGHSEVNRAQYFFTLSLVGMQSWPLDGLPPPVENTKPWLYIYLWISLVGCICILAGVSVNYYASLQASRKLFRAMLARLIRAPSRFFDVTPLGRILNRFTTDMNVVDSTLQHSARNALVGGLTFIASFLFIIYVIPRFTPAAVVIAWLYIRIAPRYIQAARDLRRLESVSLSPAFSGFDELLKGIAHIRAFSMETRYQEAFYSKVDTFQGFDHVYIKTTGLGSVVVFFTTVFALWTGASDGFTAIVIVQAGVFANASRSLVRVAAQLELDFNSIERIGEYLQAPQEAPAVVDERRPPAYWPSSSGQLIIEDLTVRYSPDLPPVLNRITFSVNPGEKIGVVGRTGSGKSTLALTLLRMVEPSAGKIILDGIDISSIGLEDLRKRITIVSQDVSLFTGTIRSNLDPLGDHTDLECWDVMDRCHLIKREGNSQSQNVASLDSMISPTGALSSGERQLVALARAILRRSQLIILDEATSHIDIVLDDQIQRTIREELSGAMVITIAHRLKTIIDYDRILVLGEGGHILEFDTPQNLINKQESAFREVCKRSSDWEELSSIVGSS